MLAAAEAARQSEGGALAGYIAYEAGLALEPNCGAQVEALVATGRLAWRRAAAKGQRTG